MTKNVLDVEVNGQIYDYKNSWQVVTIQTEASNIGWCSTNRKKLKAEHSLSDALHRRIAIDLTVQRILLLIYGYLCSLCQYISGITLISKWKRLWINNMTRQQSLYFSIKNNFTVWSSQNNVFQLVSSYLYTHWGISCFMFECNSDRQFHHQLRIARNVMTEPKYVNNDFNQLECYDPLC